MDTFPTPLHASRIISALIPAIVLALALASPSAHAIEGAGPNAIPGSDRWKGMTFSVDFGPSWRSTRVEARGPLPNTVGGALGVTLRQSMFTNFFVAASSQIAVTSQLGGRSSGTIGDWGATEVFPLIPTVGFRLGNLHLSGGYPMFGYMVLLSKDYIQQTVKYTTGKFYQASLFFETESGLFGGQYRWGTFAAEEVGSASNAMSPPMGVGNFTLLFVLPIGK